MSDVGIPPVSVGELRGSVAREGDGLHVQLEGNADMIAESILAAFLAQVHQAALRLQVSEVVVDLRALASMSSSCFKGFLAWLDALQELPADRAYFLRMLSDPARHWQRRSFSALACFAIDLVRVE